MADDDSTGLRSDGESNDESEIGTGPQLEPWQPQHTETPIQDTAAADTTDEDSTQADSDPTLCGAQGLAESQLEQQPFVVPYPSQRVRDPAGARIRVQDCQPKSAHSNTSYELEIAQDKTNPYAPFASQMDWEIAKWAKLRGPGSTAFGELMTIPGVCISLSSVKSGRVTLFRYMRNFKYHSKDLKNLTGSSTTSYQGGPHLNATRSWSTTRYAKCTIETSSPAFVPCLETQTLPRYWCFGLRSTMWMRKRRSVCIMTYRLDVGGGARR
jgi:hypothetical protein